MGIPPLRNAFVVALRGGRSECSHAVTSRPCLPPTGEGVRPLGTLTTLGMGYNGALCFLHGHSINRAFFSLMVVGTSSKMSAEKTLCSSLC